jgi:hypothetical protein
MSTMTRELPLLYASNHGACKYTFTLSVTAMAGQATVAAQEPTGWTPSSA